MVKIEAVGQEGEPVLMLGFTREDLEILIGGEVLSQTMRSRYGIEATIMVMVAADDAIIAKLHEESRGYKVSYKGPLELSGVREKDHG